MHLWCVCWRPGAKDRAELTHAIEIEATVTSFKKGTASVGIQVYTPGVDGSPRQIYALMKVCRAMSTCIEYSCKRSHAPPGEHAGHGRARDFASECKHKSA
jgi:hypothetical protein